MTEENQASKEIRVRLISEGGTAMSQQLLVFNVLRIKPLSFCQRENLCDLTRNLTHMSLFMFSRECVGTMVCIYIKIQTSSIKTIESAPKISFL